MDAPQEAAPAPAPAAAPAPVAEGMVSLPQAEVDQLRTHEATAERYRVNAEGMAPWMENARKLGINSPDDFAGIQDLLDACPKGLTMTARTQWIRAVGAGQPAPEVPAEPQFDAKAAMDEFRTETRFESAKEKHQSLLERQNAAFDKRMAGFHVDGASAQEKHLWRAEGQSVMEKAQVLYAEGHPLAKHQLMPLDDAGLDNVFKTLAETRTGFEAERLAAAGDKANQPKPKATPTTAGSGDAQGEPETKPRRATGKPMGATREGMQATADRLKAARAGGPTSTLAG